MLVQDGTDDQSGVGIEKEMRENERSRQEKRWERRGEKGREKEKDREGERIVKDDVRDRRIATADSVKDVEILRPGETVRVMFIDDVIYK